MKPSIVAILLLAATVPLFANTRRPPNTSAAADLPDAPMAPTLPTLENGVNQVLINSSFADVDPLWALGALVKEEGGEVVGIDSAIAPETKIETQTDLKILYRKLVTKDVAAGASYLGFISGELNAKTKAEVIVSRVGVTAVKQAEVLADEVARNSAHIPINERSKYSLIFGFIEYNITASLLKETGGGVAAEGFGAKINGKWHNLDDNASVERRLVALVVPLESIHSTDDLRSLSGLVNRSLGRE